jgi:hypothetical protein
MLRGATPCLPNELQGRIADMEREIKDTAQRGDFSKCGELQKKLAVLKAQWKLLPSEEEIESMVAAAQVRPWHAVRPCML